MKHILILLALLFTLACAQANETIPQHQIVSTTRSDYQEDTVYITRTGDKYHRGDCQHLSKSKIAIKRKDAIARGYAACKVCRP